MTEKFSLRIDRLKALRAERKLSQRELSRLSGIGEAQINKYESGQSDPSSTTLTEIAQKLDVSTDYLLGLSDDPKIYVREPALNEAERQLVDIFRREGWAGVIRAAAEKLSK